MKKKILITLIALMSISVVALSLTEFSENPAPISWGYEITWDDSNCSCGTITQASLAWAVWQYINNDWVLIDHGTENIINYTENVYAVVSTATLTDCPDCCKICAKVTYWDSNGICCTDDDCDSGISSSSLIHSDEVIGLVMY